ncbi:hypothetical protein DEU56DRAFT_801512 [Suillus clintonianus]|uniref:uncharacterized protein n=1 Tax=Suillus clintonianus TaxID=1904413 RepID=UPI001B88376D|nr:uncharacterized protein DEU56DRAFT_801512 [Suillus clintonianus]KAG2139045.1 hypothetical protein DEU56DRAFT_801512 [Suillus clintonianus]
MAKNSLVPLPIVAAAAFWSLALITLGVCHITRTRTHCTAEAAKAMLGPRNTDHEAEIRSRIHPHEHFALTSSSAILDPSRHDSFIQDARALIASVSPQQCAGWQKFVKCAEKCTEIFLPNREVDFAAFIQSVIFCIIITGFYGVDPGTLSPVDVAFMTNALNRHSVCASQQSSLPPDELYAMMRERICTWVGEERATRALETILPAYESMWRVAAVTLAYAKGNQHTCNAFLDFSENPTQKQFRSFKVKNTRPSVEAIINEVLRLHPPIRRIARKTRHPWWERVFYPTQEIADIGAIHRSRVYGAHLETFDAMRFYSQHEHQYMRLLAFGHGGLSCVAAEWAPMATALIVAKIIDKVDDVRYVFAGKAFDARVCENTRMGWDGCVVRKKERGMVS